MQELTAPEQEHTLTVRPIGSGDDEAMANVIRTVMTEFGACGPGFSINDAEVDHMSEAYSVPRSAYFVVTDGDRVLGGGGVAQLEGADESVCELRKMYLLPDARGAGMGRAVLQRSLDLARALGFRQCYLETLGPMSRAHKLYEQTGFRRLTAPMGDTGHPVCDVWYVLDL